MSAGNSLMFNRILLKLSGQSLGAEYGAGFSSSNIDNIVKKIKQVHKRGVEIAIVIGGGNFLRGKSIVDLGIDRECADKIGMMATIMNSLCMENMLKNSGIETITMSSTEMNSICEPFKYNLARKYLSEGKVVILGGGTGNPYFTTDSAAALRALEINADILFKATRVDGVYSADPEKYKDATKFDELTFEEVIEKNLKIMDMTAFTLLKDNRVPVVVFDIEEENIIERILEGEKRGTIIK